ncbi:hypothetical protein R1flu_000387 [Riccia fluitans]|uniref:Uncharacterized protein n=1 Tax=Riccia fluitans TaxID=41844 RepID=A0ABD1Y398_9MARC
MAEVRCGLFADLLRYNGVAGLRNGFALRSRFGLESDPRYCPDHPWVPYAAGSKCQRGLGAGGGGDPRTISNVTSLAAPTAGGMWHSIRGTRTMTVEAAGINDNVVHSLASGLSPYRGYPKGPPSALAQAVVQCPADSLPAFRAGLSMHSGDGSLLLENLALEQATHGSKVLTSGEEASP